MQLYRDILNICNFCVFLGYPLEGNLLDNNPNNPINYNYNNPMDNNNPLEGYNTHLHLLLICDVKEITFLFKI